MASASVAKVKVKASKMGTKQAYVQLWAEWKNSGAAPATRKEALAVLSRKMSALGTQTDVNKAFLALKRAHSRVGDDDGETLNDSLSFIVWDLTENHGKAMDYRVHTNFFAGILEQARNLIYTYSRVNLKIGNRTLTMPTVVYMPGRGATRIVDIPQASLGAIADEFIEDAKTRILRWKSVGADQKFVKTVLRKLALEVLKGF